jgi:hypothetical protein
MSDQRTDPAFPRTSQAAATEVAGVALRAPTITPGGQIQWKMPPRNRVNFRHRDAVLRHWASAETEDRVTPCLPSATKQGWRIPLATKRLMLGVGAAPLLSAIFASSVVM